MRLFANANYDFIGRRRTAYVLSAALLVLALLAGAYWQITRGSWLNYGVDFTGGTIVQVIFKEPTTVAEVRAAVDAVLPGTEITRFGGENEFLVRAPVFSEEGTSTAEQLVLGLVDRYGQGAFEVVRTEAVGPKIGGELQQKALFAILLSLAATLAYLAVRFEWRFGVAAVIATAHDVLLSLGLISTFRLEVALPTVAAVLTIVGYSLNDTIVIFDRVRENMKKVGRRMELSEILNLSINETLPRTVLTSTTTLATLFALFVLGGSTIREFALILLVGILIGTYSSIFVASPVLLEIERRWKHKESGAKGSKPARAGARV
jgi:preprotein translocase subunit SecF